MLWLIALLMYSMVIVNETVDISLSDALLDDCRGRVEISGNSKLAHFNGTVIAFTATIPENQENASSFTMEQLLIIILSTVVGMVAVASFYRKGVGKI